MRQLRERYNAKARQSNAGSSHKKRKRVKTAAEGEDHGHSEQYTADPNAEIVVPKSEEAKEQDRKERLRQEVRVPYHHI